MNICENAHSVGNVAARLSAVTVGRTVGAVVDAVAAGNWFNGNPSFSLSVDD